MIKIVFDILGKDCWKICLTKDMRLNEILECIKQQFYSKERKITNSQSKESVE